MKTYLFSASEYIFGHFEGEEKSLYFLLLATHQRTPGVAAHYRLVQIRELLGSESASLVDVVAQDEDVAAGC